MEEKLVSPQEHIRNFERAIVDGDITVMAQAMGALHEQWDDLSATMRTDILKLDAIFLSMLNARVKPKAPED